MNVYLDTETTGLGNNAEIIQIGIINETGDVLLDTLVKCRESIPRAVSEIHGITKKKLANAPDWADVHDEITSILTKVQKVFIYNAEFDIRLLKQTCQRHGLPMPQLDPQCIMRLYANTCNYGRFTKLTEACYDLDVDISNINIHSAVGDCEMTRQLHLKLYPIIDEANRQMRRRHIARKSRENVRNKKRAYLPQNPDDFPYFGLTKRPEGYRPFSGIPLKDIDKYEFAGTCCNMYGVRGYLFKPLKYTQ